jgi:hypothetical protein
MSRQSLAEKYDVETVYRTKRSQTVHLSDDCDSIKGASKAMPSEAAAIPVGYYELCAHCDPMKEVEASGWEKNEGWPV